MCVPAVLKFCVDAVTATARFVRRPIHKALLVMCRRR